MDTMSRDQAENSCAMLSKLDALLRNSIIHDRTAPEKIANQPGPRADFAEQHRTARSKKLLHYIGYTTS